MGEDRSGKGGQLGQEDTPPSPLELQGGGEPLPPEPSCSVHSTRYLGIWVRAALSHCFLGSCHVLGALRGFSNLDFTVHITDPSYIQTEGKEVLQMFAGHWATYGAQGRFAGVLMVTPRRAGFAKALELDLALEGLLSPNFLLFSLLLGCRLIGNSGLQFLYL